MALNIGLAMIWGLIATVIIAIIIGIQEWYEHKVKINRKRPLDSMNLLERIKHAKKKEFKIRWK